MYTKDGVFHDVTGYTGDSAHLASPYGVSTIHKDDLATQGYTPYYGWLVVGKTYGGAYVSHISGTYVHYVENGKTKASPVSLFVATHASIFQPNVLFVGHGRSGKDTCCDLLAKHTGWVNAGTCSKYFTPHMAMFLNVDEVQAYTERHQNRVVWREQGDLIRRDDPLALVRPMMRAGRIGGGVRGLSEIRASRGVVSLIVWVSRPGIPSDPTMEYGEEETDLTLHNDGTLAQLDAKLLRLSEVILA